VVRFAVYVSAVALSGVVLLDAQAPVTGIFFDEGWESGATSGSFNSSFYGSAGGNQFSAQSAVKYAGTWAFRHQLNAGLQPGSIQYATQHFGDAIAGPVLANGRGQHFNDFYIQWKVYYSPGFDFSVGIKQFIIGTQDDQRHDNPCCNPWVAHYTTIYVEDHGELYAEINNKQASSGQWIGLGPNLGPNPFVLQSGRWYTIEVRRRLNDSSGDNGIYQMWVDGQLIADHRNLRFRIPNNGSFGSNYTYGTNFAMISDYTPAALPQSQAVYYDDVKFSTTPIGASGTAPPPAAPAPPTNVRVIR
jgi:hypothetical protein